MANRSRRENRNRPEYEIEIKETTYPGIGVGYLEDKPMHAKNTFPGQVILGRHLKNKQGIGQLMVLGKIKGAAWEVEPYCSHYEKCGGCMSQEVPYQRQVDYKEAEVLAMFNEVGIHFESYLGILKSTEQFHYRNKMEYTFGDEYKDAPLGLGLHLLSRKNSIVTVDQCQLVSEDFNRLLTSTLNHFKKTEIPYYRPMTHKGTLRNLIIREGKRTGELMAILVTASDENLEIEAWKSALLETVLQNKLVSIYHVTNDSLQDAVVVDKLELIYGSEFITEQLCDLTFKITPMSFFQTNTTAAEMLYETVMEFAGDIADKEIFDLYCGTGTIGNILAKHAKHVTGIEIIEEAALIAQENAKLNNNENTTFIPGDVKDVLAGLSKAPDLIVLDPPRGGIHPKALSYAMAFGANEIIYVSCNPRTLAQDLLKMKDTMLLKKMILLDNYPNTSHVEAIVLMCASSKAGKC